MDFIHIFSSLSHTTNLRVLYRCVDLRLWSINALHVFGWILFALPIATISENAIMESD